LLLLSPLACQQNGKEEQDQPALGVIVPLSGSTATMGSSIVRDLQMLNLKTLALHFEDDQCDPKQAISVYRRLRLKSVKYFYLACSGSVLALAPLAKKDGTLIITAYAGASAIRTTGPEVIRYIPDALSISQEIVKYLRQRNDARIGLLHEEQDWQR